MYYRIVINICLILGTIGFIAASFADSSEDNSYMNIPPVEWRLNQYWPLHSREDNLWKELSDNFEFDHNTNQPNVQHQIQLLSRRQDYLDALTQNATPYLFYIYSQTRRYNMPAEIALIPMIESEYDPFGISRTGATGLWQMMPTTASELGLKVDWWYDGRRNVIKSTDAALRHLQYLHKYFGNWLLTLAAYDSGDGTVRSAIRYNQIHHQPTDFWHLHLPTETKVYVPKLLALSAIIAHPHHYGVQLKQIPNRPYFDGVKVKGQIELSKVAKLTNTNIDTVRKLNPAFRRPTTASSDWLLLPTDKIDVFQQSVEKKKLKNKNITKKDLHNQYAVATTEKNYNIYTIKQGDSLSRIGDLYHTTPHQLMQLNGLHSSTLKKGQSLKIPVR